MSSSPRPDGHRRRRSWNAEQKQRYLADYEVAAETGQGAAFLRREGLYSSLISEWRRQGDAGLPGRGHAMTVSLKVMHVGVGVGVDYFLKSVVVGDGDRARSTPLPRYYADAGTSPGYWLGGGVAAHGQAWAPTET